ncbi:hypothetical protein GCM10027290_17120 [Micromonospora sonneratiae]|uniref:Lysoplasmalogenase n=1 Tax=Micromonospora sonneratiae TaxID=1184706 RepID=A0ABW3YCQ9_9ACTN
MPRSRAVLIAYAVLAVANVIIVGFQHQALEWATKPLLMPLLGVYVWLVTREHGGRTGRLVLAALALSTAGDVTLLSPGTGWFLIGMSFFLGAQLCYIAAFLRAPAGAGTGSAGAALRRPPLVAVPIAYAVLTATALAWLWPGLTELGVALPVAVYATALVTMAASASGLGWWAGVGGVFFVVSDLMIAIGVADVATLPGPPIWVMLTYLIGQTLIVTGWLARSTPNAPVPTVVAGTPAISH